MVAQNTQKMTPFISELEFLNPHASEGNITVISMLAYTNE